MAIHNRLQFLTEKKRCKNRTWWFCKSKRWLQQIMLRRIYKLCRTLQGPEVYTIPLVSRMHTHCRTLQLRDTAASPSSKKNHVRLRNRTLPNILYQLHLLELELRRRLITLSCDLNHAWVSLYSMNLTWHWTIAGTNHTILCGIIEGVGY